MTRLPILISFLFLVSLHAITIFPELTGRIVDKANLLSTAQNQQLTAELAELEHATTDQLVIVTLTDLQGFDIADIGYQLGRQWGIGQKEKNNGVLLIIVPNQRKVRIEVGYGLEGILTDLHSTMIIQNDIIPFFKKEEYGKGIVSGTEAIIALLNNAAHTTELPSTKHQKKDTDEHRTVSIIGLLMLFLSILIVNVLTWVIPAEESIKLSTLVSAVTTGIIFLFSDEYGILLFIAIITYIIAYFGIKLIFFPGFGRDDCYILDRSDRGKDSTESMSGNGSFSGGGGSFGGGGASGKW